jgi:hypothetical protein
MPEISKSEARVRRFPRDRDLSNDKTIEMTERKTFYSVGSLARLAKRTRQAVLLRLQQGDIEPDAEVHLPGGRRMALFEGKTLAVIKNVKAKTQL